jgi:mannose-6-phosphate isomerase-like protein (cupin superfamily)
MEKKETIRRKLLKKAKDFIRSAPIDINSLRERYCTPETWTSAPCHHHRDEHYAMTPRHEMVPAREVVT